MDRKAALGIITIVGLVGLGVVLAYGFGVFSRSGGVSVTPALPAAPKSGSMGSAAIETTLALGGVDGADNGTLLGMSATSASAAAGLGLAPGARQALDRDMPLWCAAYGDSSPARMRLLMEQSGVEPPPSWSSAQGMEESWKRSLGPLGKVRFDQSRTAIRPIALSMLKSAEGSAHRCGQRDSARPFLADEQAKNRMGVEVLLFGWVDDPDSGGPVLVRVGIALAWNPGKERWVVVRTCLYDFPNSFDAGPPVL